MAFDSSSVKRLRRDWVLLAWRLALLVVPAGVVKLASLADFHGSEGVLPMLVIMASVMTALLGAVLVLDALHTNPNPVALEGHLVAGDEGVVWNGRTLARRAQIAAGFFIPGALPEFGGPGVVRLERRFPRKPLAFEVADEPTGRALLEALGLDASQTTADLRFAPLVRNKAWASGATVLAGLGIFVVPPIAVGVGTAVGWLVPGIAAAVVLVAALLWSIVYSALPTRVQIGGDGLVVKWLWQRNFIRCQDIVEIRVVPATGGIALRLGLRGGGALELPMWRPKTAAQGREEAALAMRRIQHAAALHVDGDRRVALPERAGRAIGDWVRSLRATGSGANADHRTAPIAPDQLFRIVEDPGADPLTRGTAAVALGGVLDPDGRARLRVAASATAAPEVRGLLELAAEEEASEEALGAALERLAVR